MYVILMLIFKSYLQLRYQLCGIFRVYLDILQMSYWILSYQSQQLCAVGRKDGNTIHSIRRRRAMPTEAATKTTNEQTVPKQWTLKVASCCGMAASAICPNCSETDNKNNNNIKKRINAENTIMASDHNTICKASKSMAALNCNPAFLP